MSNEDLKLKVAKEAVKLVKDGMVIGLGTGSTAALFIRELGNRIREEELTVFGIPTSFEAKMLAMQYEIPLVTLDEYDVDIAFDGADEVEETTLFLIKGGGGCHTQEKIVDYNANEFVVLVDESKLVKKLGEKFPIPVEVIPSAYRVVIRALSEMGGEAVIRLGDRKRGPVITDNGNMIIDVFMNIDDAIELEKEINNIPGVVENGIFTKVDKVLVGTKKGVKTLKK
ncbi:TPA: ribose-5-phosphate isomerase RpiA [Methanocaldococcus jannaschii]|uniref:Ribose-5-phosphate isomerase A n=2 Tax=Methanocaldococcus jannaschii TaxID=2190 RepID=RPIA_METJA|nr:ribose-5-phosphate isomerase RpiA [Methanocaldococcus jannaschii]Q58998.1 RecName: Full=Ribose-5-phosphate isomerase A; AltName: Full=Phosphoriboisomerase A; Short=PRI [Methanocaldococcus jannaschii DSM 2661]3IXQ_A Chain A, Ribose-5-phosphate isomerase A [Methanocaldococcus jannaschii]3IXQ_B Chain B, Ribose-5-phosphate isomerase A [Methanocaldococcus jannaschii]3IXQ_C Chain C, Ribose-5-phosphate isomerase A [Methanocaldococcus jannaschii]3IXQ_D Chain D, Ribose-5-phosphate isomerase A [Metha